MHAIYPTAHDGLAAPADAGTALGHRLVRRRCRLGWVVWGLIAGIASRRLPMGFRRHSARRGVRVLCRLSMATENCAYFGGAPLRVSPELPLFAARGQQRRAMDSAGNWPSLLDLRCVPSHGARHSTVSTTLDLALRAPLPSDLEQRDSGRHRDVERGDGAS